jgi:hypothetical protein
MNKKKLTYGPRDVIDVSWALLLIFPTIRHHLRCLHVVLVWRSCTILVPITLVLQLPVPTPQAVAHGSGWGCCGGRGDGSLLLSFSSLRPLHPHVMFFVCCLLFPSPFPLVVGC